MDEVEAALNKLRKQDRNANELFMILDEDNKKNLLSYYNDVWVSGTAPEAWKEALVISIFKGKGSDTDPGNYRPISLLNAIYNIFAAMLQTRLTNSMNKTFELHSTDLEEIEAQNTRCLYCVEQWNGQMLRPHRFTYSFWIGSRPLILSTTTPC